MALIEPGEQDVRIINVDGDKDSDAMSAAVVHVQAKHGSDVTSDYVIQGPNYACRLHFDGQAWKIISHEDNDGAQTPQVSPAAPLEGVEDLGGVSVGDSGNAIEPVDNDGEPKKPSGDISGVVTGLADSEGKPVGSTEEPSTALDVHAADSDVVTGVTVEGKPLLAPEYSEANEQGGFKALDLKADTYNEPGK